VRPRGLAVSFGVHHVEELGRARRVGGGRQRLAYALGDGLALDQLEVRARNPGGVLGGARAREQAVDGVRLADEHLRRSLVLVVLGSAAQRGERHDRDRRREDQPAALAERVQQHEQPLAAVGRFALR
jgi:hypothetical protein